MADRAGLTPVYHPLVGGHVRLGKRPKKADRRNLKLATYLRTATGAKGLPRIPAKLIQSDKVLAQLPGGFGMMRNDAEGDCSIAGQGHAIQTWTALAGQAFTPPDDAIQQAYIPGTGNADDGRFLLDVLNYMVKTGIAGHRIGAFAEIDRKAASAHRMVRAAIDLFGGAYIGVNLPVSAQRQSIWTVTTGPDAKPGGWGGHCVWLIDYDSTGPTCVTWGETLKMSWGFFDKYCDEAYAIIAPDFLAGGKTPRGFDAAALQADLAKIRQQ